jgi:hypothetical protein
MGHDHHHKDGDYYLEQYCTIGICGALGVVMVLLYEYQVLDQLLAKQLQLPVYLGGLALLVLVAIRAVAVWSASRRVEAEPHSHDGACAHDHDHDHGAACGHEHAHDHDHKHAGAHEHNHGHEHGFAPWRYVVLLLPVALFLLHIPWPVAEAQGPNDGIVTLDFAQTERAALSEEARKNWEGKVGRLKGPSTPSSDPRRFQIVAMRMQCCRADAVPINIVIDCAEPQDVSKFQQGQWIEAAGRITFLQRPNGTYITALHVDPKEDARFQVRTTEPGANLYVSGQ